MKISKVLLFGIDTLLTIAQASKTGLNGARYLKGGQAGNNPFAHGPNPDLVTVKNCAIGSLCRCEGNCDNDQDCLEDLACFTPITDLVPGCTGSG
mmetsp:Transcript_10524/g.17163  ORF Transcript_10524/g.17163 Transcript_10524/m.17163 type:complete len:95 (-) Transcript_10524:386-670(-)